ncbi:MAG: 4'-phosphopantetheinyl transferase [Desulfuromonas sp.]|nr:MAG: 4'-phosphopantetheinyl transferase [Desulfuromonas sp.]
MAVIGIGVDLARIERFQRLLERESKAVIERIFTAEEQEYSLSKRFPAPHLAVRFAAKEAYLKALGTGLRMGIRWQDISVVRDDLGCPSLHLSGRAAELLLERGGSQTHLSYSHDGLYGVATVVLEG